MYILFLPAAIAFYKTVGRIRTFRNRNGLWGNSFLKPTNCGKFAIIKTLIIYTDKL
ncbi:hypothetical protein LEP1GSC128_0053 [Leptospira borgpetersenii str. 200801926]|uniref:Uncharacterized protein n=2 Tax=Leptospira borgpetersenii TaxID=174 RepID=A0ABN0I3B3_LEPBO|nr:hypothetical protein LEP1GSC128_0053 [Leptospira borgpetersenii str. 200801926]EMN12479.1 hypothetical protein LEP1GSC055_1106 [Leptospira borgpetersenii str. Brem 307]EMN16196.1 hypothetical protein LEP1GSC056_0941 [Leptospira borgpetersenii str. Brem 328]